MTRFPAAFRRFSSLFAAFRRFSFPPGLRSIDREPTNGDSLKKWMNRSVNTHPIRTFERFPRSRQILNSISDEYFSGVFNATPIPFSPVGGSITQTNFIPILARLFSAVFHSLLLRSRGIFPWGSSSVLPCRYFGFIVGSFTPFHLFYRAMERTFNEVP